MKTIEHKFTDNIPKNLEDGVIYISMKYSTAIHKCACGCGNEVVTPFSPDDWCLLYNGQTISLSPSIGNWHFECKSHYWIKNSKICIANDWGRSGVEYVPKPRRNRNRKILNFTTKGKQSKWSRITKFFRFK